jgi:hypothetical protein
LTFSGGLELLLKRMPFLVAWTSKPDAVVEMGFDRVVDESEVLLERADDLLAPVFFLVIRSK